MVPRRRCEFHQGCKYIIYPKLPFLLKLDWMMQALTAQHFSQISICWENCHIQSSCAAENQSSAGYIHTASSGRRCVLPTFKSFNDCFVSEFVCFPFSSALTRNRLDLQGKGRSDHECPCVCPQYLWNFFHSWRIELAVVVRKRRLIRIWELVLQQAWWLQLWNNNM